MQDYSEINIYVGLPPKNNSQKGFNIYTDIDNDHLIHFRNKQNFSDIKNCLFINGLPSCMDKEKDIYWHKYNDKRFNGLAPNEKIFKEFPNLKLISTEKVKSIALAKYFNFGLLISGKATITLNIRQGKINEILDSIGLWIQQVSQIKLIGLSQTYFFNNNQSELFLDKNIFTKNPKENSSDITFFKSKNQNENKPDLKNKGKIMNKILAELDNKNSSRINLIKKEAYEALVNKNENIFLALSFYLNRFEFNKDNKDIDIKSIREIRILAIGAEGIIILVNNSVIKVYRDKYFRMKNEFNYNHEPDFLLNLNSDLFPKPKNRGYTYMELDYLGSPIGTLDINLMNPYYSVKISGDVILNALKWIKELDAYINKFKILHGDIQLSNILYDNVLNKFTLIDFTHSRSEYLNGKNFKKELPNLSQNFIEDSKAIERISKILIQKLVFEYLKANQIDDYYVSESVFNFLNNDEKLKLSDNNFEDEKLAKLILMDTKSLRKKIKFHNISVDFSILPIYLLKNSSKVVSINSDIFNTRIFEGIKIKNNLINLNPLNRNLSKYTFEKEYDYEDILIISDINEWINYDFIDKDFDKFIKEIKYKCKFIYICINVIDDISRYSKFITNYFSKIGYLCKKIEVSNHGIESKNFNLLRLNI